MVNIKTMSIDDTKFSLSSFDDIKSAVNKNFNACSFVGNFSEFNHPQKILNFINSSEMQLLDFLKEIK